jgi:predicted negative regulator of RcsB-dependent stress response
MMLAFLTILPLFAQEPSAAPSPNPSPPAADQSEKGSAMPGAAGLEVLWTSRLSEAVEGAKRLRDGRILIFFVEPDCGQCKRMEALVVPSTSFYSYTRDKVPLLEDVSTAEGKDLARRLRIRGTPTWIVVTPDLLECGRQEGPTTQQGWVNAFIEVERGWAGYKRAAAAEAENPGDAPAVYEVARQLFQRGAREQAETRFRRLAADPNVAPELKDQVNAYLASIDLDARRFDEAAKRLDTLIATARDPVLKQRAELRRADVEIARGRRDLATWRLKEFLKAHSDSPLAAEAQALLDALQGKAGS